MMSRAAQAAMLAAVCGLATGAAQANVVYDFVQTSASGGGPATFTGNFEPISLTFTNAQVAAGSTSGTTMCNGVAGCDGGLPGFVRSADGLYGVLAAGLTFNPDGSLTGSINNRLAPSRLGNGYTYTLTGSGDSWTGTLLATENQRYLECGAPSGPNACTFSGYFTGSGAQFSSTVPEPTSWAVLGFGLLGVAAMRRRA
jgi:hypothetical protein